MLATMLAVEIDGIVIIRRFCGCGCGTHRYIAGRPEFREDQLAISLTVPAESKLEWKEGVHAAVRALKMASDALARLS
jgi:hypothetical protein